MTTIKLTDAAKYYREEPHQIAAWNALQGLLTPEQVNDFAELYRAAPRPSEAPVGNTWDGVAAAAKAAGAKFPELVAAQWALESGWGKHLSGQHNYFGLKGSGTSTATKEFINGKWVIITDSFIDFPDLATCVQYLVDRWYKDFKRYQGVNRGADRNAAARLLVAEGYATDPQYAEKLIRLMDQQAPARVPAGFTPSSPFSHRVTPHIQYGEIALWSEARRFHHQHQCNTALLLCQFIERARAHFGGRPVIITSGYRPPKINAQVGGASRSEHLFSAPDTGAVDWYIDGVGIYTVENWVDKEWPYSCGYGAPKGFNHLGIRPGRPRVRWDY